MQKKRCAKGTPFLLSSRLADGLQLEHLLLAELDGTALPREGHDPLKHKSGQMYRYLENHDLVLAGAAAGFVSGLAAAQLLKRVLFSVDPTDWTASVFVIVALAIAACLMPAISAVNVDPIVALRWE